MNPFSYHPATDATDAARQLSAPGSAALGGGTDLLVTMKEELAHPDTLVDLRRIPGARDITLHDDGSARIGCAVRIADLAEHEGIRARYAALAEAAASVGTPQLRNSVRAAGISAAANTATRTVAPSAWPRTARTTTTRCSPTGRATPCIPAIRWSRSPCSMRVWK